MSCREFTDLTNMKGHQGWGEYQIYEYEYKYEYL